MSRETTPMIYYVEDDQNIQDLTLYACRQAGFEAEGFLEAWSFFEACKTRIPDLILLDIMLPEIDGMEVLARVRADERLKDIPVIMLTAKGTEFDTICGLDAGADDYLAKPFSMMELISRINALLRRAHRAAPPKETSTLTAGCLVLDPHAHTVKAGEVPVDLTLKEFELLQTLMENPGRALSRSQLFEAVWGSEFFGGTRTVDVHMQTLRQKLDRAQEGLSALIETVRGVGYRLNA